MQLVLTPELVLEAYRHGLFPMARSISSAHVHWICPERRALLPILRLHVPRRLRKRLRAGRLSAGIYTVRVDTAFDAVIDACAHKSETRPDSWINAPIAGVFKDLHRRGAAHSVECWVDDLLMGGVYGLAIGGAFFGESMFSRTSEASKVALIHLCARLWRGGFTVLDTQFVNPHLRQFGVYEVPHESYLHVLGIALARSAVFGRNNPKGEPDLVRGYLAALDSSGGCESAGGTDSGGV